RMAAAGPLLDSIVAGVAARKPPVVLDSLAERLARALGSEAALALPTKSLDLADGRRLYDQNCSSCHGPRGLGDGPAARGLNPAPARVGDAAAMGGSAPAMAFRKISVGVTGTAMPSFEAKLSPGQRWNVV